MTYEESLKLEENEQSEYSPGKIESCEIVARLLVPEYVDSDGSILPTAFSHIVSYGEVSVLRSKYDFNSNKQLTIEQLMKNPKNIYRGYILAKVGDLKNILHEESKLRVCYLMDSATKDKKGHADIKELATQIIAKNEDGTLKLSKKTLKYLIQKKIWEVFDKVIYQ